MPSIIWEFFEFCKSVVNQWSSWITGGIIALLWICYEKFTGKTVSMKVFVVLLCVGFFIAAFSAWRDQYLKSAPHLKGEVDSIGSGASADGKSVAIFLLLGIANTGPPTVVDGFNATVKFGKSSINLRPNYLPADNRFHFGEKFVQIKPSEMIYEKVVTPIPQGGRTRGWLYYFAEGVTADELRAAGWEITVRFKDVNSHEYVATSSTKDRSGPGYFPGVDNPFMPFMDEEPPAQGGATSKPPR